MRTLVIGAGGFVGGHLASELESAGSEVIVSDVEMEIPRLRAAGRDARSMDILQPESIRSVIGDLRPERIVLLAAQSSVGRSWEDPAGTIKSNILGSVNVLEAVRLTGLRPRILLIGSSEEYGPILDEAMVLDEDMPLAPSNPYAITKTCQEDFGRLYQKAYGQEVLMVRSFNHIGPGQRLGFVVPDFCSSIVSIERGENEPVIMVGNLEARRDLTDVRDVVKAYRLLLERGKVGEVYNVGSGHAVKISTVLDILIRYARVPLRVEIDPAKYRPVEIKSIVAGIGKIKNEVGWNAEIPLESSLIDILEYWRKKRA
jgi:GDP-4-dehydro-6-deoxy-D-mannose reductase